jgi:acid phosphatase (class A)
MRSISRWTITLLVVGIISYPPSASAMRNTTYISPSQVFLIHLLEPPPAPDSQAQKDDLKTVLDAQAARTPERANTARADAVVSLFAFVKEVLGPNFTKDSLPLAVPFFERVYADQLEAAWGTKEHFGRPRPSTVDKRIEPIVRTSRSPSYPSSHAITAYVYATILSMMVPEKSRELFERAAEYGHNRVVGGVHFPSDIAAGRVSAAVIVNTFLQQPAFMRDFNAVKAEVRQTIGLK